MIEYRILFFSSISTNLLMFIATIAYWRMLKTYPGWGLWVLSNGIMAVINISIVMVGFVDTSKLIYFESNLMILLGWVRLMAFNRFFDHKDDFKIQILVVLVAVIFLFLSSIKWENISIRTAVLTLTLLYFISKIGFLIIKHSPKMTSSMTRVIMVALCVYALSILYRAIDWFIYPEHYEMFTPVFANIQFSIVISFMEIVFTGIFMALQSQRLMNELTSLQKRLEELASTDPLTGLINRRMVFEQGEAEFTRARRYRQPLSLILIDLDNFKEVNDNLGHIAGDYVLEMVCASLQDELRQSEIFGRLGGDEFLVILTQTEIGGALATAARLSQNVKSLNLKYAEQDIVTSISVGVAELGEGDTKFSDLLHDADLALYRDKKRRPRVAHQKKGKSIAMELENDVSL